MFNNKSIIAPKPLKPHIVKREGYWRVSSFPVCFPMTNETREIVRHRWRVAHAWVSEQNRLIHMRAWRFDPIPDKASRRP